MIQFSHLTFIICPCSKDGNSKAELLLDNGYQLDIIKKPLTKTYKVKPFEITSNKKWYQRDLFPEHGEFPEFKGRDALLVFLNEIKNHVLLEDEQVTIDIDIQEEN
jgi:hypothetical protein